MGYVAQGHEQSSVVIPVVDYDCDCLGKIGKDTRPMTLGLVV